MAHATTDTARPGADRTLVCAATLLSLLVVLVAIADGFRTATMALGVVVLGVGAFALIRGRADWLRIVGRPAGAVVLGLGFVTAAVGSLVTPAASELTAATAAPSADEGSATAPLTPAAPVPTMAMTCPADAGASPLFDQQIAATAPYTVVIDYGDGEQYTNDDQHLGAVFSHTYPDAGSFTVTAVLRDATGQTATATCAYSWTE